MTSGDWRWVQQIWRSGESGDFTVKWYSPNVRAPHWELPAGIACYWWQMGGCVLMLPLLAGFGGSWVLLGMEEESCPGKLTCLGSCQLLYSLLIKAQRIKCCHQRIPASLLLKWCSTTGSRAVASTPPVMGWQTSWGWNGKSRCGRRAPGMGASRTGRGRTHGDGGKPVSDSQGRWANAYRIDGASSLVYSSSSFAWWTWTEIWVFLLEVIQM